MSKQAQFLVWFPVYYCSNRGGHIGAGYQDYRSSLIRIAVFAVNAIY